MIEILTITAGGLGALLRFGVGIGVQSRWPERPVGTALVNIAGAAALGALLAADPSAATIRIAGTGFLGGFTTFSTWMVDTWAIAVSDSSHRAEGLINVVGVLVVGWVAFVAMSSIG